MPIKLVRLDDSLCLEKRQHMPYRVEWECEVCGKGKVTDFSHGNYLHSPVIGDNLLYLYCDDCDHSTNVVVKVDLTMALAE